MTRSARLLVLFAVLGCGSDAPPSATPFDRAPASPVCEVRGEYHVVTVYDAVRGSPRVLTNGYPIHFTYSPGSSAAPGNTVGRNITTALVSGRNEVVVAVAPSVSSPAGGAPSGGPARFRAWVCSPDGEVVVAADAAAADSAFVVWERELRARWPAWAAAENSAYRARPALADSFAAVVAEDAAWASVGVGVALDSARAWAAREPVAVRLVFERGAGDGQPSFDALFREAPVLAGTAADSARLRAYAVRLRDLSVADDGAALYDEFEPSVRDRAQLPGREPLPPATRYARGGQRQRRPGSGRTKRTGVSPSSARRTWS